MATLTVKQSGGDYTTLAAACAAANDGDIISIEGTWSVNDTANVTISDSISITCDADSRFDGIVTSTPTHYRLRPTSGHAMQCATASKTITIDGIEVGNASTGVSDEIFRINADNVNLKFSNSCLYFLSRVDQQDCVYIDTQSGCTVTFEQCYIWNIYRGVVDAYNSNAVVNINSCHIFNVGYSTSEDSRSGAAGFYYNGTVEINVHNSLLHINTGSPINVAFSGSTVNGSITNSITNAAQFILIVGGTNNVTESNNTVSASWVTAYTSGDEVVYGGPLYAGTSYYDLRVIDDAGNIAQDAHTTATASGLTIPSTDIAGTARPQNTNYEIGAYEIASGGGGDTTDPTLGGSVTVSAASSSQLDITYPSASDDTAVTSYILEQSADGSTGWTTLSGSLSTAGGTYNDTGLSASQTKYYRVTATDAATNSVTSAVASGTTDAAGSVATISAVTSSNGADTATALGTLTITVGTGEAPGITDVTVNGVACTSLADNGDNQVTCTCPKAFGDNYGASADVIVTNATGNSTGYAVTTYIPTGYTETDFTVAYAGLSANSPFYGDSAYSALVAGDSCVYESVTTPDSHSVTMAGDGDFTLGGTVTAQQTFDFYIFDDSDNTAGTDGTITINPSFEISATTDTLTLTEYPATVSLDRNIAASTDNLTLTEYQASISSNINISATTDSLTLTEYPASIALDKTVQATTDNLTLTEYPATVQAGSDVNIQATTDNLTITEYQAQISLDRNIQAITDALSLVEYPATITQGVNVSANTDALTLTEYAANITYDVEVITNTDALQLITYKATVDNGQEQGGGISKKKRKNQQEYEKAFKSAKTIKERRAEIAFRESKLKRKTLTLKKPDIITKEEESVIDRINQLDSQLDIELATELYINQLEFKRRENEALTILLLL